MSAYAIFTKVRTIDPAEMRAYNEAVMETTKGHPKNPRRLWAKRGSRRTGERGHSDRRISQRGGSESLVRQPGLPQGARTPV